MDKCCKTALQNIDYIVMGAPAVAVGAAAGIFGAMETKSNCVVKAIGYIGNRISVLTFALAGLPLLIYSFAKTMVLKGLNLITFKKFQCLQRAANNSDNALKIFFASYGASLIILANIPALIAAGGCMKRLSSQIRPILEEIRKNDGVKNVGEKLRLILEEIEANQKSQSHDHHHERHHQGTTAAV